MNIHCPCLAQSSSSTCTAAVTLHCVPSCIMFQRKKGGSCGGRHALWMQLLHLLGTYILKWAIAQKPSIQGPALTQFFLLFPCIEYATTVALYIKKTPSINGVILLVKSCNVISSVPWNICGTSTDVGASSVFMYVTFIIIIFYSVSLSPGLNSYKLQGEGNEG